MTARRQTPRRRKQPTDASVTDDRKRRRFRQLEVKVANMRGQVSEAEQDRIAEKLRRAAAKTEDLDDRLVLVEEAFLAVFGHPSGLPKL